MKLKAYIKLLFIGLIRSFHINLLVLTLFPVGLALFLGYFQSWDQNTPKDLPTIEVAIVDQDKTNLSRDFIELISNSGIIEVSGSDKSNYQVTIPSGYQQSMLNQQPLEIEVFKGEKGSSGNADIIVKIIDSYNSLIHRQIIIEQRMDSRGLSAGQREELLLNLNSSLGMINAEHIFSDKLIEISKVLTSYETTSISIFSFSLILVLMVLVASNFLERENGLYKRINSTPITRTQYFNYSLVGCFILAIVFNGLYMMIFRLSGLSFRGEIFSLIGIVIVCSIFITGLAGFIWAFMNKGNSNILLSTIMILQMLLNGMLISPDAFGKNTFFHYLVNFSPDILITKILNSFVLLGNVREVKVYMFILIVIAILAYSMGLVKANIRWREE